MHRHLAELLARPARPAGKVTPQAQSVGMPKQQPARKQPIRVRPMPRITPGEKMSAMTRKGMPRRRVMYQTVSDGQDDAPVEGQAPVPDEEGPVPGLELAQVGQHEEQPHADDAGDQHAEDQVR